MKLLVAGSRDLDPRLVYVAIDARIRKHYDIDKIDVVVSGRARGVDQVGEQWAKDHGIPIMPFVADWKQFGMSAGHRRNAEMGAYCDEAIICWDGASRGTAGMIRVMERLGKPVHVVTMEATRHDSI